ncbi:hypothetical protein LCGC14_0310620 [marine sediment metagenome]|uniref:Uncharacterized protein n=1 Tax=marine sediment metagenome TaxID=412755 RepID=A0A0F9TSC3_9ZZZZ
MADHGQVGKENKGSGGSREVGSANKGVSGGRVIGTKTK